MPGTQHVETETVNTVVIMQLVRFTEPMTKLGLQPSLKIGDDGVMTLAVLNHSLCVHATENKQ